MARRAGHSIPKYRKHRGSGQAIVTIAGRDHYIGPHGSKASRIEYDRLITEWLAAGRPATATEQDEISVAELIVRFWNHARRRYVKNARPTSEQHLFKMALAPVRELYGQTFAVDFGPLALKAVRTKLVERGCARKTVNDNTRRVVRMFRWGVAEQLVPPMVLQALLAVEGLRKGSGDARETAPIMPVENSIVDAALEHLPAVVADMVRLQRLTGCRPAEVCILRPCDLDRTGDVWTYKPESHKTEHHGRERIIFIGPQAQGVLLRYLARAADTYCFRPCDSEAKRLAEQEANRKTPASCGNCRGSNTKKHPKRKPGLRYTTDSYRRAIHRACDRAGVARWSPNRLRHTAATAIRREFGLEAAQVILGHSQANVTQVYAERDLAKGLEVAAKIG